MESSKHDLTLSGTATSLQFFFLKASVPSAKSFQFKNFSETMFYENYLASDLHTNTVVLRRVFLLFKIVSKTMIRPINDCRFLQVLNISHLPANGKKT